MYMKKVLVFFYAILGLQCLALGSSLTCSNEEISGDSMVILADQVRLKCSDGHYAAINGIGVGLRFGGVSGAVISCIGNFADLSGTYYGVKGDVAFIVGVAGSAFVSRKGVCTIGSFHMFALGAGVSISSLQIYK